MKVNQKRVGCPRKSNLITKKISCRNERFLGRTYCVLVYECTDRNTAFECDSDKNSLVFIYMF